MILCDEKLSNQALIWSKFCTFLWHLNYSLVNLISIEACYFKSLELDTFGLLFAFSIRVHGSFLMIRVYFCHIYLVVFLSLSIVASAFASERMEQSNGFTCFTYEMGENLQCELNEASENIEYCQKIYGENFLAFEESDLCTTELADHKRGFVDDYKLGEGIEAKIKILSELFDSFDDKILMASSAEHLDFIIKLYEKLYDLKIIIQKRSHFPFKNIDSEKVDEFIKYALQYHQLVNKYFQIELSIVKRLSDSAKSVNYNKLEKLKLVLSQKMGKKLLFLSNLKSKNLDSQEMQFEFSKQEELIFEYKVLENADNLYDYAKLISFLALRDQFTNLWAIDRMSEENFLSEQKSCNNFTSFFSEDEYSKIPVIHENRVYDFFENKTEMILSKSADLISKYSLIDGRIKGLLKQFMNKNIEFRQLLTSLNEIEQIKLEDHIERSFEFLTNFEEQENYRIIKEEISFFILPGDSLMDREKLLSQLTKKMVLSKKAILAKGLMSLYPWQSGHGLSELLNFFDGYLSKRERHLKTVFHGSLSEFFFNEKVYAKNFTKNREYKIEETLRVLDHVLRYKNELQRELPSNGQALLLYLNSKMPHFQNFSNSLIENDSYLNEILLFIKQVDENVNKSAANLNLKNSYDKQMHFWKTLYVHAKKFMQDNNVKELSILNSDDVNSDKLPPLLAREKEQKIKNVLQENPYLIYKWHDKIDQYFKDQFKFDETVESNETSFLKSNARDSKLAERQVSRMLNRDEFFHEFFKILKIGKLKIALERGSLSGYLTLKEFKTYNDMVIENAYTFSPILRLRIETEEMQNIDIRTSYGFDSNMSVSVKKNVNRDLLNQIYNKAYDSLKFKIDKELARSIIDEALYNVGKDLLESIDKICSTDFSNLSGNNDFKNIFESLSYQREQFINMSSHSNQQKDNFRDLDQKLSRLLERNGAKIDDDFVRPNLARVGVVSLVGLAFIGAAFLFPLTAPAVLLSLASFSKGVLLSVSFNALVFSGVSYHTYQQLNSQFIEVPAQLKIRKRMFNTQIEEANLYDYGEYKEVKNNNDKHAILTLGLIPLDLYFGRSIFRDFTSKAGKVPVLKD